MITYANVVTVPKTQIKIYTICQPTDLMILKMLPKNADYIKILRCLHYKCVINKHSMFAFLLENDDGLNSVALHNKQGCCLTGAQQPGAPKKVLWAPKVLQQLPKHNLLGTQLFGCCPSGLLEIFVRQQP